MLVDGELLKLAEIFLNRTYVRIGSLGRLAR